MPQTISEFVLTDDLGFERAATDVVCPSVLDGDEMITGLGGVIDAFIALPDLLHIQFDFGRCVDGDRQ